MTSTWESDWQLAARERDDLVAERDALAAQNTALIKQMGASVENERQWGERVAKLEAALDDRRTPRAAEWKYLDDGVTLMKAALQAIPELYRDGDPNQLHYAIKEWLSRPEHANSAPSAEQPPLLERTLKAGYDIQTRQRDEIRELRKVLDAIHIVAVNDKSGCPRCTEVVERCIAATPPETACECMPLDVRGTPGDLEIFCPKCGKVFRKADTSKAETDSKPPTWEDLRGAAPDATGALSSEAFVRQSRNEWDKETACDDAPAITGDPDKYPIAGRQP